MKIVLVVGWYFPESNGGSEVFVGGLARELGALGHQVQVAAPHDGEKEIFYEHENIPVYRYPVASDCLQGELDGIVPSPSAQPFQDWLDAVRPDVVHFHSWTRGVGYWHLRRVREKGYPLFLTIHTPAPFCSSGTMWRWRRTICDGSIHCIRCAACYYQKRGLPSWVGIPFAAVADRGPFLHGYATGRLKTALHFPSTLELRRQQLRHTWEICQRVIVVSEWLKEALLLNGCPGDKLFLSRQGSDFPSTPASAFPPKNQGIRFGFLGRFDDAKGVLLLVNAFCRLPKTFPATLELKGIPQGQDYLKQLTKQIQEDARIRLLPPSPRNELRDWLGGLDVLVVPSLWMETGPLVIYEAFANHVPVIGANHGGIAELVQDRVNGLLFKPHSAEDLTRVLTQVCEHPEILTRLHQGIGVARCMQEVAREMAALYQNRKSLPSHS